MSFKHHDRIMDLYNQIYNETIKKVPAEEISMIKIEFHSLQVLDSVEVYPSVEVRFK